MDWGQRRENQKISTIYREATNTTNGGAGAITQTALTPVEGYGASEMRFGLFVGAVAAVSAVAYFMLRKPKNGGRRRRRRLTR